MENAISVKHIKVAFGEREVIRDISCDIHPGDMVSILGCNGCGKSVLLKVMTGNLKPLSGTVEIAGRPVSSYTAKDLAGTLAFLPQYPEIPADMLVGELVACGRYPYQRWWKPVSEKDKEVVRDAMKKTNTYELRDRTVASLSGGERQRVWIAMDLAQEPHILILDEPTTYLDICHQLEIMDLIRELNRKEHITVVMVIHDLNHACRYSDRVLIVKDGLIKASGQPDDVIRSEIISDVFQVDAEVEQKDSRPYIYIRGLEQKRKQPEK